MSGQEILRTEWAMHSEIKPEEILPAWCYEFTRQHLIELRQRQDVVDAAIAAGEKVPFPEVKAFRLNWDDPWGSQFKTPYLLLNDEQRAALKDFYEPDLFKRLRKISERVVNAVREEEGEVSDDQLAYEIALSQTVPDVLRKIYEAGQRGRGALKAQLRRDLKALGVYRLDKAGYRWNRLPREPHDIQLYSSPQHWRKAQKRAHLLVQFAPVYVVRVLQKFPRNS